MYELEATYSVNVLYTLFISVGLSLFIAIIPAWITGAVTKKPVTSFHTVFWVLSSVILTYLTWGLYYDYDKATLTDEKGRQTEVTFVDSTTDYTDTELSPDGWFFVDEDGNWYATEKIEKDGNRIYSDRVTDARATVYRGVLESTGYKNRKLELYSDAIERGALDKWLPDLEKNTFFGAHTYVDTSSERYYYAFGYGRSIVMVEFDLVGDSAWEIDPQWDRTRGR